MPGQHKRRNPGEIERPDPEQTAHVECAHIKAAEFIFLACHQHGQQIGAEREKEINPEPAHQVKNLNYRGLRFVAAVGKHCDMRQEHGQECEEPKPVKFGKVEPATSADFSVWGLHSSCTPWDPTTNLPVDWRRTLASRIPYNN